MLYRITNAYKPAYHKTMLEFCGNRLTLIDFIYKWEILYKI
jgi:hypothetical protein